MEIIIRERPDGRIELHLHEPAAFCSKAESRLADELAPLIRAHHAKWEKRNGSPPADNQPETPATG